MGATWRCWVLLALCSLPSALSAQTRVIDFEDLAGPPIFDAIEPPLHALSATLSGGEILTNTNFVPADQSTIYGTSFFCKGCLPTLTLDFSQKVANVSLLVLNGQTFTVTYTVEDDAGNQHRVTLPSNASSGAARVVVPDHDIRRITIEGDASQWDFFLDDISFTSSGPVLLDPIPSGLLTGATITADTSRLAASGDIVKGLSADGSTQVVLRIPASQVGERLTVAVLDERGVLSSSVRDDGGLVPISGGALASDLDVTAVATAQGALAFAVYRGPRDYSRGPSDDGANGRHITLQVSGRDGSTSSADVLVVRPPVVLIHGLWDSEGTWDSFGTFVNDQRFYIRRADYSATVAGITASVPAYSASDLSKVKANALGFSYNAGPVLTQVKGFLVDFRHDQNVAAAQVDVVAHSMGGDIARTMVASGNFLSDDTYGRGPIHKLITIGTPHLGTPLATAIVDDANACVRGLLETAVTSVTISGSSTNGAVGDLAGDGNGGHLSAALKAFQTTQPFPTAYIAGKMGTSNLSGLDCFFCHAEAIRHHCSNDPLAKKLTAKDWHNVFGQDSDAIVPLKSQLAGSSGIEISGVVHSGGVEKLSFKGPSELDSGTGIPSRVIGLLNERSTGSDFHH